MAAIIQLHLRRADMLAQPGKPSCTSIWGLPSRMGIALLGGEGLREEPAGPQIDKLRMVMIG